MDYFLAGMFPIMLFGAIAVMVGLALAKQLRKQSSFMDTQTDLAEDIRQRNDDQARHADEQFARVEARGEATLQVQREILDELKAIRAALSR